MGGGKSGGGGDTQTIQKADPWEGQQPYLIGGQGQPIYEYVPNPNYRPGAPSNPKAPRYGNQNDEFIRRIVGYEGGIPGTFPEAARIYQEANALPFFPGQTFADFSPTTLGAFNQITGDTSIEEARNANRGILAGDYFTGGDRFMQAYGDDILDQVNSVFGRGRTGSFYHGDNAVEALGDVAARMWQEDVGNVLRAEALAPSLAYADAQADLGVGQALEAKDQQGINEAIARHNYPITNQQNNLAQYVAAIQGNYGGTSQTNTEDDFSTNPFTGALGGAATGAGIYSLFAPEGAGFTQFAPWLAGGALLGGLFQ